MATETTLKIYHMAQLYLYGKNKALQQLQWTILLVIFILLVTNFVSRLTQWSTNISDTKSTTKQHKKTCQELWWPSIASDGSMKINLPYYLPRPSISRASKPEWTESTQTRKVVMYSKECTSWLASCQYTVHLLKSLLAKIVSLIIVNTTEMESLVRYFNRVIYCK